MIPLDSLVVRHIDPTRRTLETVAVGGRPLTSIPARTPIAPDAWERLVAWARQGDLRGGTPDRDPVLSVVCPPGLQGAVLAGPLGDGGLIEGVVLVISPDHEALQASSPLAAAILHPLTTALRSHVQSRDASRLRETLETDRRTQFAPPPANDFDESIVGANSGLRKVMERVAQVAPTDAPVLILGENGTGKEVFGRAGDPRPVEPPGGAAGSGQLWGDPPRALGIDWSRFRPPEE
ncbi:MAG: sigma 54-interacting transcriptional regulator [Planctomycetota bacterium]